MKNATKYIIDGLKMISILAGAVFTMSFIGNKIFRRDSTAGSYGDGSIFCIEVYGWFCVWYHRLAIKCAGA